MKNWEQHFQTPVKLKLYIIHTGYVHMSGNIHFNRKSPRFKVMPKDNRFNPVLAFLVEHPKKGFILLDTGLHPSFAEKSSGNFGWLLGKIVKVKSASGQDVVKQLEKIKVNPKKVNSIILSHLHLDHTSGLPLFSENANVTVYADQDEISSAQSPASLFQGYVKDHRRKLDLKNIQYRQGIPPFDHVCDFLGDGSVFVIKTPGHTTGNISILLNMAEGPIFLTFDASHRRANIQEFIPPKGDYETALRSIRSIKAFIDAFPKTRMIFGHDPDQFKDLKLIPEYYS